MAKKRKQKDLKKKDAEQRLTILTSEDLTSLLSSKPSMKLSQLPERISDIRRSTSRKEHLSHSITEEEGEQDTMPAKIQYKETDEEIEQMLKDTLTQYPGRSLNKIHMDTNIPSKVLKAACDRLVKDGFLTIRGDSTAMRYFPKEADRRTINPDADKPLLGKGSGPKKRTAPAYNPSPSTPLDPPKGIPADLKAYEPIVPLMEHPPEPAPEPIPELIPEPTPEPAPAVAEGIDIDALFTQLDALRTIPRNGPFDAQLDAMVADAETRIRSSLLSCPHCGRQAKLMTSEKGEHSIRCACGAWFAYGKDPTSLKCTIKAYNRRVGGGQ